MPSFIPKQHSGCVGPPAKQAPMDTKRVSVWTGMSLQRAVGRQAASPKCDTGGSSGTSPFRTSKARLRHGSGTQVEPLLQVTGLAASLTSQHMGGE